MAAQVQTVSGTGTSVNPSATWASTTTAGNLLIAHLAYRSSSATTPTAPANWTLAGEVHASPNGTISHATYYALPSWGGTMSGAQTWTIPSSVQWTVFIEEYSGVDAALAFDNCFFEASTSLSAAGDPTVVGADTQPGGSTGFAVCHFVATMNTTNTDTYSSATDGPQRFTYSNHANRNVTAMCRATCGWTTFSNWEMLVDAVEQVGAGGSGIAGGGMITVFKDNSTAISNGTTAATAYVKSGQASSTGAGNTLTATFGAGGTATAGNILVALAGFRAPTTTPATPSGWTQVPFGVVTAEGSPGGTTDIYITAFYKTAAGGETGVTVDFQETGHRILMVIEATGTANLHKYGTTKDTDQTNGGNLWFASAAGGTQTSNGFPVGPTLATSAGFQVAMIAASGTNAMTSTTDLLGLMSSTGGTIPSTTALKCQVLARTTSTQGRAAVSFSLAVADSDYCAFLLCFGPPLDEAGWAWHGADPRWQVIGG